MTLGPQTLFTLFGDFTAAWPSSAVREHTGDPHGDPAGVATWLAALNNSVRVGEIRTGAAGGRVAAQAALSVDPAVGFLGYTDGWSFVLVSMPDVEFRVLPFTDATHSVNLFASAGNDGVELVLEGLPVEIRLPAGLLEPHPDLHGAPDTTLTVDTGEFEAGRLDDLRIVLRRGDVTSIFVHVRISMTSTYGFDVQPAVPISIGRCSLSAIPCVAVHDFRLVPSPEVALDRIEWLRHDIHPWHPLLSSAYDGLFTVRSVDIDEKADGLQDAVQWFNDRDIPGVTVHELVLGDLAVPFDGPLPIPRHITTGVRRSVLDPTDANQVFAFDHAPIYLELAHDPRLHFALETLYYQSQPSGSAVGPPSGLASGVKPGAYSDGIGLTFTAEFVFGEDTSPQQALEIGLQDDYTIVAGYKRAFGSTPSNLPGPEPGAEGTLDAMLSWSIAGSVMLDIIAIRGGLSIARQFVRRLSFKESSLLTIDLFVSMPPFGEDDDALFRLRALDGQRVAFTAENIGWRLGQWHFEGLALPDGVVAWFWRFGLLIYELGLVAEDGASYVSFSGGIVVKLPSALTGGVTVRRLRFRVRGNEAAASVKVDGFFLLLRTKDDALRIDAGGYYSDRTTDGTTVRELGLSGTVAFKLGSDKFTIGLDLLIGHSSSATERFDYFMAQAFYKGVIAAPAGFELIGARLLYARDMVPKLETFDGESRDLRYYRWYTESNNPLTVSGDRRLAAWSAEDRSWTFGVGASASFPAFGKVVDLTVFVLGVDSRDEKGLLVVGEVRLFSNPRALGYLAVEVDVTNDRTSILVGVDARASSFVKSAPAWMDNVGKFTGTLYICSSPGTVAVGHLADQSTWLTVRFDIDLWLKASFVLAICFEYVDHGPKGFGITTRVEGGIGIHGVIRLTYNAGWTLTIMTLTTSSSDYAAVITIKAGIHFELFGFLRIGVSAEMDFRVVGVHPATGELTAELRLETPWFLPDVTWRLDCQFGQLAPGDLASAAPPLRTGGATEPAANHQLLTHIERFDPSWDGQGTAPLHSVNELSAPIRPEAERLANVAADTELRPVAIDATISVLWSVAVNDQLGLSAGIPAGLGDQKAGDLALSYDLIGIGVRRRPRFGPVRPWQALDQKLELQPVYGGSGVQLSGSFGPQVLNKAWDLDVQIAGQPAAKKLLLNGVAPYEFSTADPEADERLVRSAPDWPCCRRTGDKELYQLFHTLDWHSAPPGDELEAPASWPFTASASCLRFLRAAWARPASYAGIATGTIVATASPGAPGIVARADFDEDVAFVRATVAWAPGARLSLVALDGGGQEVARRDLGVGTGAYVGSMFGAAGPIRRLELRAYIATPGGVVPAPAGTLLELAEVGFVGLRDYLNVLIAEKACDGGMPGGSGGFDGSGKLSFLPNHEYEVKVTTRVTIGHPSTAPTASEVDEFVYFHTKGLPGLNAVARTGDELEPYVLGAYAGGRAGLVYRVEPVTLAFSEGLQVALPLAARSASGADEHATLLEMQLLVQPDVAVNPGTTFTTTSDDWIVAHRGTAPPPAVDPTSWVSVFTLASTLATPMLSVDPLRLRLAATTQRPSATCVAADPVHVSGTVLIAPPQGGGPDPEASPPGSAELWAANAHFTAAVRLQGAGFVDRRPFLEGDETALTVRGEGGSASWTVADGVLAANGTVLSVAEFGDSDWDHLTITVGLVPGASRSGVGFALPATGIAGALFAVVVEGQGEPPQLLIGRGNAFGGIDPLGTLPLPAAAPGANAPITLVATLFDDRLRAAVGDAVLEVDRGDTPSGPAALVADGPAAFSSLQVQGLDLYAFPFAVSRFRSFAEHVGSWPGRLDTTTADALGAGTSGETVAGLWTATAAAIAAAMSPDAPSADRDRVFSAWVTGLGLPLKDELAALELTRVVDAGQTSALVIESPEPIDFTAEVTVALKRRIPQPPGGVRPPVGPPVNIAASAAEPERPIRERLESLALAPAPAEAAPESTGTGPGMRPPGAPGGVLQPPGGVLQPPGGGAPPPPSKVILDVTPVGPNLVLELAPALGQAGRLSVIAVEGPTRILYSGLVRPGLFRGQPATMLAERVGLLEAPPPGSELIAALAHGASGEVFLASSDLMRLLGWWKPSGPAFVDVPVQVLQSGDARRAIVVPVAGAQPTALPPGSYQMTLALVRKRWQTIDSADALNTYQSSATLLLEL